MTVVVTFIFQDHGLRSMKQEHAAEHIMMADVLEKIRSSSIVSDRQAKMVIGKTDVFGQIGLCPGKTENARFAILAYLVVDKGRPAIRTINHDSGQEAFRGPALRNRAGGIKDVDRGMLVAADVTKRHTGNAAAGNLLQVQRAASATEDLDVVPSGSNQVNRLLCAE